jgi:hypothetical protein
MASLLYGGTSKVHIMISVKFWYFNLFYIEISDNGSSGLNHVGDALQLPGMQSIPTVGVIYGGIYGLNVFPIPLNTRENTCKIKCRKGLL